MPTYQIYANCGVLSPQQKSAAAVAVTDAHCQQTGAPRYYVQVIFHDIPEENRFVA